MARQGNHADGTLPTDGSQKKRAPAGKTLKGPGYERGVNPAALKDLARAGGGVDRPIEQGMRGLCAAAAYGFTKSPHFGACSLPQGMSGTVDVEFCGEPSISLSV